MLWTLNLTVSSNTDMNFKTNLPRLIFMINDNHLYPIEDPQMRETIFKSSAICGGGMKKYKAQQQFENDKLKINEKQKL